MIKEKGRCKLRKGWKQFNTNLKHVAVTSLISSNLANEKSNETTI